jgi:hypothetical protein
MLLNWIRIRKWWVFRFNFLFRKRSNLLFLSIQIVGATEEVIEEEGVIDDGVIQTIDGQQYVQTANGFVKLERDHEFDENIIYR